MVTEFDIWSDDSNKITAEKARKKIVDDGDAPYGYSKHCWRVFAANKRHALKLYRSQLATAQQT